MYGYLRDGYRDVEVFRVDLFRFEQLMLRMANQGEWRPALEFLGSAIAQQTGIRGYIAGEKVLQGFFAAYLSVTDFFVFRSEAELGKGHADISLEPLLARFPHLRIGRLPDRVAVPEAQRAGGRGGRGGGGQRCDRGVAGATWRTSGWRASSRACDSWAWRWCSTVGKWRSATRWRSTRSRSFRGALSLGRATAQVSQGCRPARPIYIEGASSWRPRWSW